MRDHSNTDAASFGFALFAPASGMTPETMRSSGHFKRAMDDSDLVTRALVRQRVVSDAAGIMRAAGLEDTHAGIHLRKVACTPAEQWTDHHFEVSGLAAEAVLDANLEDRSEELRKSAFTPENISESVVNSAKAVGIISLLTGAGLGAGYFGLNRAMGRDSSEIERKEQQLSHFRRTGEKLQKKLESKYGYQPDSGNRFYPENHSQYV